MQPSFYSTFRWLLLGVGAACTTNCYPGVCDAPRDTLEEQVVATDALDLALADDEVTLDECIALCDLRDWARVDGCSLTLATGSLDPGAAGSSGLGGAGEAANGEIAVTCKAEGFAYYCEGRRHASWGHRGAPTGSNLMGRYLANAAANEAASVQSFRSLARELRAHGIDHTRALRRAARQEIGHTRLLDRLAGACGCVRPQQGFAPAKERTLLEIALENAREGCVGETYAGLVALHQADMARDPNVRRAFALIAREEAEHAELAWTLHAELRAALPPHERQLLDDALWTAIDALEAHDVDWTRGLGGDDPQASRFLFAELGLPSRDVAQHLRQELAAMLRERGERLAA